MKWKKPEQLIWLFNVLFFGCVHGLRFEKYPEDNEQNALDEILLDLSQIAEDGVNL